MMKVFLLFVVLFLAGTSGGMAAGTFEKEDEIKQLQDQIVKVELQLNHSEVKTYIEYIKQNRITIPVYSLGSEFTDRYMEQYPVIKEARMVFEQVDSVFRVELMRDSVYREVDSLLRAGERQGPDYDKNVKRKQEIFSRLHRTSEAYRVVREKRDEALCHSNVLLLEYIAREFEEKGLLLNLPFLDGPTRQRLENMNPRIGLLKIELQVLKEKHVKLLCD